MHTNPTLEIRVRVQKTLKPERRSASIRFELSACLHKPAQRSPLCRQVVLQSARSPLCLRAFARANGVLRQRSSSPTEFFANGVLRQRSSSPSEFFAKGAVLRATGTSGRTTISPMCGATLRLRGRHRLPPAASPRSTREGFAFAGVCAEGLLSHAWYPSVLSGPRGVECGKQTTFALAAAAAAADDGGGGARGLQKEDCRGRGSRAGEALRARQAANQSSRGAPRRKASANETSIFAFYEGTFYYLSLLLLLLLIASIVIIKLIIDVKNWYLVLRFKNSKYGR